MDIRTFDADAHRTALEPPRYVQGQLVHTGVVLSAPDWFPIEAKLTTLGTNPERDLATIRDIVDAFFPPPPAPSFVARLRGVRRAPSVAALVATLPFGLQLDAVLTFVNAQAAAQRWTVPGLRTKAETGPPKESPKTVEELQAAVTAIVTAGTDSPG